MFRVAKLPATPSVEGRTVSALDAGLTHLAQHITSPGVKALATNDVDRILQAAASGAAPACVLAAFDQLWSKYRVLRQALPHFAAVLAFLTRVAPARLAAAEACLTTQTDARLRSSAIATLYGLRRPPMAHSVIARAETLLQLHHQAAPQAEAGALGRTTLPAGATQTLQIIGHNMSLQPLHKQKLTPQHLRAGAEARTWRAISTFELPGQPRYSGVVSPTVQQGSYCKFRVLLTWQGEVFAVRQAPSQPQRSIASVRLYADGSREDNRPLHPVRALRYLHERESQHLAGSPLLPLCSGYDAKQRLWDVLPLYDGDLHTLCETVAMGPGLLLQVACGCLRALGRLSASRWQHNDVKPENILWRRSGEVELADYGLAAPIETDDAGGTDGYLDPEAILHPTRHGGRADLYALAMTLIHLQTPYDFDDFPLRVHADGATRGTPQAVAALRHTALMAEQIYGEWTQWYAPRRTTGAPPPADPTLSAAAAQVHRAFCTMYDHSPALADLVFLRWVQPTAAGRGLAEAAYAHLRATYGEDDLVFQASQQALADAAKRDAACVRIDHTVAALQRFRDAYVRLGASPASALPSSATA